MWNVWDWKQKRRHFRNQEEIVRSQAKTREISSKGAWRMKVHGFWVFYIHNATSEVSDELVRSLSSLRHTLIMPLLWQLVCQVALNLHQVEYVDYCWSVLKLGRRWWLYQWKILGLSWWLALGCNWISDCVWDRNSEIQFQHLFVVWRT